MEGNSLPQWGRQVPPSCALSEHRYLGNCNMNDDMGKHVAEQLVKKLINAEVPVRNARVGILGFTFKENCQTASFFLIFSMSGNGRKVEVADC